MGQVGEGTKPLKLALLVNDTPVGPVVEEFGKYPQIYARWLEESKPTSDITFQLDSFDAFEEHTVFPDAEKYDAIILTGSAASAYSPLPWIDRLKKYVANVATAHPQVRLIGICFGHQIIASALGGECVPNDGTWEIGVTEVPLTPVGKAVFGTDQIAIQQFHRDHVPTLPPGFILLGSTTVSAIQGMLLPYPTWSAEALPSAGETHILTVQGHPEFTGPIVEKIVEVRAKRGILDGPRAAKAKADGYNPHDGKGCIGQAIWKVMLAGVDTP
ncbi:hypothetical protein M408DRAFT_17475 [Serendipita vermifera MAFF 305830]|uniref:Glutamine amidotransferase domain-containing protein n=1 Tax=Serendipita vermifera MAFF 305830 TaxID=933852 RepID=A0A0C2X6C1_SERVB|nr:hypothetical protein M408DRAFT_17475 [Serendipita vermifera MAFF 305830]